MCVECVILLGFFFFVGGSLGRVRATWKCASNGTAAARRESTLVNVSTGTAAANGGAQKKTIHDDVADVKSVCLL